MLNGEVYAACISSFSFRAEPRCPLLVHDTSSVSRDLSTALTIPTCPVLRGQSGTGVESRRLTPFHLSPEIPSHPAAIERTLL